MTPISYQQMEFADDTELPPAPPLFVSHSAALAALNNIIGMYQAARAHIPRPLPPDVLDDRQLAAALDPLTQYVNTPPLAVPRQPITALQNITHRWERRVVEHLVCLRVGDSTPAPVWMKAWVHKVTATYLTGRKHRLRIEAMPAHMPSAKRRLVVTRTA